VDFLGGNPPSHNSPNFHPMASRQHGGAGPHPEGGGPQGKKSSQGGREDSDPPGFPSAPHPSRLHPVGGEPLGGCSLALPVGAGLASRPASVSPDIIPVG
jgi:hypothetical protein